MAVTPDRIRQGRADIEELPEDAAADRVRKKGGLARLDRRTGRMHFEPITKSVDQFRLHRACLLTNRSTRELSFELVEDGFVVSPNTIDRLLRDELDLGRRQAVKTVPLDENAHRNDTDIKELFQRRAKAEGHD